MTKTHIKTIAVAPDHDQPKLSKRQQAFNNLIKQIEKKRSRLSDWEAAIPFYRQKYTSELLPLVEKLVQAKIEIVRGLDQVSEKKELTKTERIVIASLIRKIAEQVLERHDDADLKAIYNKHSNIDYDSVKAASIESMKSMMEDMFGIELGDVDMNSPDDMLNHAKARIEEELAKNNANRQSGEEHQNKHKKSAKQLAKETRQQAEEQQASLSIREVYRKLASALHPDREPDAQERKRKTSLMQRVNEAYEKRNLLQLLKLQLELEHIDHATINNISEDRLKHYNKILKEQLVELEQEINYVEDEFVGQFGIDPFDRIAPNSIMRDLAAEIVEIHSTIQEIQKDILVFEDIKKTKVWLKKMQRQAFEVDDGYDACPF